MGCRTLFEDLDADSSGGISGDELAAGLRSHGYSVTADEAEQLMKRMDLNDDGALVFDEFASGLLDWRGVSCCYISHDVGGGNQGVKNCVDMIEMNAWRV